MNATHIALFAAVALLVACAPQEPMACTQDAKICPDGTAVGRQGPNCEFAPCPGEDAAQFQERRYLLCSEKDGDRQFEEQGWTCVDECPAGYDGFSAQIGRVCVRHYGEEEIASWPTCRSDAQCRDMTCGKATHTTRAEPVPDPRFRCLPQDYEDYMVSRGLELADGGMVIA